MDPTHKKDFRKKALCLRDALSVDERTVFSEEIRQRLQSFEPFCRAETVMTYMSFRSEVITDRIVRESLSLGKRIIVPISLPKTRTLLLSEINNIDEDFETDFYGVRIPKQERRQEISASEIDLVLVPGVAFSKEKYRMGYGGGYYDRFLETVRKDTVAVALAFEIQIYDDIPRENHDKKMHHIITERRIFK